MSTGKTVFIVVLVLLALLLLAYIPIVLEQLPRFEEKRPAASLPWPKEIAHERWAKKTAARKRAAEEREKQLAEKQAAEERIAERQAAEERIAEKQAAEKQVAATAAQLARERKLRSRLEVVHTKAEVIERNNNSVVYRWNATVNNNTESPIVVWVWLRFYDSEGEQVYSDHACGVATSEKPFVISKRRCKMQTEDYKRVNRWEVSVNE